MVHTPHPNPLKLALNVVWLFLYVMDYIPIESPTTIFSGCGLAQPKYNKTGFRNNALSLSFNHMDNIGNLGKLSRSVQTCIAQ